MVGYLHSQPVKKQRYTMNYSQQCLWHPCSQMKDYENFAPLMVERAEGAYLYLQSGEKVIDAISSWWCKSLGHNHPRLKNALLTQVDKFEHVLLANTTNETIIHLSERLTKLTGTLNKVFYAGDGSTAVEIALKMSLHAKKNLGQANRTKFISLKNSYHGETVGAMSLSDVGLYKNPYQDILFDAYHIQHIPYVAGENSAAWSDCSSVWEQVEAELTQHAENTCAVIVEPIIQGAGGMRTYSQDFLKRLRAWTIKHDVYLIADEIMTGLGRTGKMFACDHAGIEPDFICLGKSLTAGWVPFSAVLTRHDIYDLFYADYESNKAFLHSNTFSGNALAASIAIEVLTILKEEKLCEKANFLGDVMLANMQSIASDTGRLTNIRSVGAMIAADLVCDNPKRRFGYEVYQQAVKLGALLRPLGNTIYWLPPLNSDATLLNDLSRITKAAIIASS
jgi:adenosylmethionine-8-amino-7-oxononanoate aminotransferase